MPRATKKVKDKSNTRKKSKKRSNNKYAKQQAKVTSAELALYMRAGCLGDKAEATKARTLGKVRVQ